ncbi:MAG TPA: aminotransferase class III-fold pyridoxal phosphate-dependent enzyme [Gammaproteobacteria bacterium]|nr:aminotransferase class III-fold pyridoxal phosphate-dependent enzyme [Gammaproteobacteria bacterium]
MHIFKDPPAASAPPLLSTYTPYPFPLLRGAGEKVYDDRGQSYVDFYGGHCVASTGHSHPEVAAALARQASELIFYSAAARLPVRDAAAAALVDFAPAPLASAFFCNSGAEANENALKLAAQITGRHRFAAFEGAFHGRTLLALAVSDAPGLKQGLEPLLPGVDFLPFGDLKALAAADLSRTAAVIVEPIQSMAGVKTAPAAWFAALRDKCAESGALLVFDEVQTGVGRLGKPFAADFYSVVPDMLTLAKGIASGVPMGALLMSGTIAAALKPGDLGSTFGGGPLACAALLATLDVIWREKLMEHAAAQASRIRSALAGSFVSEVRGEGLLLGLNAGLHAAALKKRLQERRILVGGSSDPAVLRLMPPLNVPEAAVDALLEAIGEFGAGLQGK